MMPAYLGPQAPCTSFRVRIRPGRAEWQGRASARNAIRLAQLLGMHRGAVLYDDMEAYRPHHGRCSRPVVAFLDGWTRELHARGYRAGVYSSAAAATRDLGRYRHVYGHPVARPNSLWFALWDGRRNLRGTPHVRNNWWHAHRIKQYRGGTAPADRRHQAQLRFRPRGRRRLPLTGARGPGHPGLHGRWLASGPGDSPGPLGASAGREASGRRGG